MSGSESGSDGYTYASPSPTTRRNGPFLGAETSPSYKTDTERSFDNGGGIFSRFTGSNERPGEPVPATSTPDLSFDESSSPCRFLGRESPSLRASARNIRCGTMDPIFRPTSEYASFVHRLDYLLQQAADHQQCNYRTGDNLRIQSHPSRKAPGLESQMLIAHDAVPEPALSSKKYDSRLLALHLQKSPKSSTLVGGAPDNDDVLAPVSYDAAYDSRQNKRKAQTLTNEGSLVPAASLTHDWVPCDSYLSASDSASPAPSLDFLCPPSKKRKCVHLNGTQLSVGSPCTDSPALSDPDLMRFKSTSVQGKHYLNSITTYIASERVQFGHYVILVYFSHVVPGRTRL